MICLGVVFSIWIFLFAFLYGWPLDGDVAVTISWAFAERRCRGRSPCNVGPAASIPARINIAVNYALQFLSPLIFSWCVYFTHLRVMYCILVYPSPPPTSCNFGPFVSDFFVAGIGCGFVRLVGQMVTRPWTSSNWEKKKQNRWLKTVWLVWKSSYWVNAFGWLPSYLQGST